MKRLGYTVFLVFIFTFQFNNLARAQNDTCTYKQDTCILQEEINAFSIDPHNWSVKMFRCINDYRTDFLDGLFTLTNKSVLPVSLVLPLEMLAYGIGKSEVYEKNTGFLLATSELLNLGLTFGIKSIVKENRPLNSLKKVHYDCESKKEASRDPYSFPSGHTSMTATIATTFLLRYPRFPQVYIPMYLWMLTTGYGRIYSGMHYPHDVFGGIIVGAYSAVCVYGLRNEILDFYEHVFGKTTLDTPHKKEENNFDSKSANFSLLCFISALAVEYFVTPSSKINISPSFGSGNSTVGYNININF